jgi:hypothetical protein
VMANCHLATSTASMQDSWAVVSDVTVINYNVS